VLIACFGNVLRGDDGFGAVVARLLLERPPPDGVHVLDIGIGGIHLVQELLDPVDALVVVDAVDIGRPPGTVVVLHPDVRDVSAMTLTERREELADTHYTTPDRAFTLARGLGVLPDHTVMVGCQVAQVDELGMDLSPAVERGVAAAAAEVRGIVTELGAPWS
jgi:hydrogenase maturation protease